MHRAKASPSAKVVELAEDGALPPPHAAAATATAATTAKAPARRGPRLTPVLWFIASLLRASRNRVLLPDPGMSPVVQKGR
jgi:hypothetical protein